MAKKATKDDVREKELHSSLEKDPVVRDDYVRRAFAAYFRAAEGEVDQPSSGGSNVEWSQDKPYVLLRNGRGVLAAYRIRNDGMLKRLRRWPKDLE